MNKKNIIKIINKELIILSDISEGFAEDNNIHPIEIELALSKTTDIYNMFLLLKDNNTDVNLKEIEKKESKQATVQEKSSAKKKAISTPQTKVDSFEGMPNIDTETSNANIESQTIETEDLSVYKLTPQKAFEATKHKAESELSIETEEADAIDELKPINETTTTEKEEKIETFENAEVLKHNEATTEVEEKELTSKKADTNSIEEINDKQKNTILADKFTENTVSVNDMLSSFKKDKNLAALLKDRPVTDLKKAVKINDRIWYIKELFENNADTYNTCIEKLNTHNNLDEALSYIFTEFNWDQSKKSTISFLELVYRKFAPINE